MRPLIVALATCVLTVPATAAAAEPGLRVHPSNLRGALKCAPAVTKAKRTPVLLVAGTGMSAAETWAGPPSFEAMLRKAGHASCRVTLPFEATGDVQTATEYVVHAIRETRRRAGRSIAIYGLSQGGLLPRLALTYWPSLRKKVGAVVSVSGGHHGTTAPAFTFLCDGNDGCVPAAWQQIAGSNLLTALNSRPDETPGPTRWITVRSATDELVDPSEAPALEGANNIEIQSVCPGRETKHIASVFDSVSVATLLAALGKRNQGDPCTHPYWPGADADAVDALIESLNTHAVQAVVNQPKVPAEPALRSYAAR